MIVSGSVDKTVKLWNTNTGECIKTLTGHDDKVNSVNFSSDNKFIVSGSDDKRIKVWNIDTGECIKTLIGHNNDVLSVNFLSDN